MGVESSNRRMSPTSERYARYRWAATVAAGDRVLDAACGAGWGTALLAKRAATAVGVDFSPAIADARRDYGELADFWEADLRDMPFAANEFDIVVCFEAITHVAEPEEVLDELRRVLIPNGTLLISAPNRNAYPAGNPLQLSELSSTEMEQLLRERFANVEVHRQQTYFASLLGSAGMLAEDDPSEPIEVGVAKLAGGTPGSELHAVAAASDGELPAAPASLVLGAEADYEEQQRALEKWRERAVRAEADALALRNERRGR